MTPLHQSGMGPVRQLASVSNTDRTQPDTPSSRRTPCPICGRTKDGDCTHSVDMAFCHHGSTLAPPTGLHRGDVITGADGRAWGYVSTADGDSGTNSTFVLHRESTGRNRSHRPVLRTVPKPAAPAAAPLPSEPISFAPLERGTLNDGVEICSNGTCLFRYSEGLVTKRIPKAGKDGKLDKDFIPHHLNGSSPALTKGAGPNPWPLWHEADLELVQRAQWILETEGETCANYARIGGIVAISQPGHGRSVQQRVDRYAAVALSNAAGIVYLADNDEAGHKHADHAQEAASIARIPMVVVHAAQLHAQMPPGGSIDDLCRSTTHQKPGFGIEPTAAIELILEQAREHQKNQAASPNECPAGDQWPDSEEEEPLEPATIATIAAAVTSAEQASALTLDPEALIGGELGAAIDNRADRLHVPAAVLINGLLPAAASQLPRSVRVMLNEDSDFTQPPILWNLSVAPTGSNKSETSDISVKPLYRFQEELPADSERSFFTSKFTLPGLSRTQAGQPDHGCLINPDELSGFVRNLFNEQKSGRGDELSSLLSIYDGRPLRGNFSDKSLNYNLKGSSFSLLSTIQPSVLLECMGDLDDASGLWARFNLCEIPLRRRQMTRSGRSGDGLMPALQNAYRCLQTWEPKTYGLTDEAADLFDAFYASCEDQRTDQTLEPALQAYAAKQEGRCGRIALVLHCLQAAARKVPPTHQISAETMLGAITVCDFYQQQLRRFYSLALAQVSDSLEGNTLLVFEFIKREAVKTCTIRQINKGPRALRRMTVKQIQQSVDLLTKLNLIRKEPDGWRLTAV